MPHARYCGCLVCYAREVIVFRGESDGGPIGISLLDVASSIAGQPRLIEDLRVLWRSAEAAMWRRVSYGIEPERVGGLLPVKLVSWTEPAGDQALACLASLCEGTLPGDEIARLDVASGAYERYHTIQPGEVVIDVGAHAGYFTARAQQAGAEVVAIEPENRNFSLLRRRAKGAVIQAVAGKGLGLQFLHTNRDATSMHSCRIETVTGQVFPVVQIALDQLQLPRVDFIKIDVEGMEVDVLQGATATLREHGPDLVVEVHGHEGKNLLPVLREAGYGWIRTAELLVDPPDERLRDEGIWYCHKTAPVES